jgi:hypothetical protein
MRRTPTRDALQIEHVAPDTLLPYAGNPRTISAAQMAALQRSISQFGFVDPVLSRNSSGSYCACQATIGTAYRARASGRESDFRSQAGARCRDEDDVEWPSRTW